MEGKKESENPTKNKMTKEERRKMLKQKLRDKINSKANGRLGKQNKNNQMTSALNQIKEMNLSNEQLNSVLSGMIKDPKARKKNKKRIQKMMGEDVAKQIKKAQTDEGKNPEQ